METVLRSENGIDRWHWQNVIGDLQLQAGYHDLIHLSSRENPSDDLFFPHEYQGLLRNGESIFIKWHKDYMFLWARRVITELVDAFSIVLECKPFCSYEEHDGFFVVLVWNKVDPERHYLNLKSAGKKKLTKFKR